METLTLPEPAATLWKKAGPRLKDAMREILRDNERWTMSGGTILTARYNVPQRFAHIQANPTGHAAQATENATWTAAALHYENRRLEWRTNATTVRQTRRRPAPATPQT